MSIPYLFGDIPRKGHEIARGVQRVDSSNLKTYFNNSTAVGLCNLPTASSHIFTGPPTTASECGVPVVPHKAVAEVSRIGNL